MKKRRTNQQLQRDLGDEVQEWLTYMQGKAIGTYQHARTAINYFYEYLQAQDGKATISAFLDRVEANEQLPRRERTRVMESEVNRFLTHLDEKGLSSGAVRAYYFKVKSFLKFKGFRLSTEFVNLPKYVPVKENQKHQWTLQQMQEFVDKAQSIRDKSFIMCSFQSGLDVDTLLKLSYGDIMKDLEANKLPVLIDVPQGRSKTGLPFKTFFGADAIFYLRLYLSTRGSLQHDSPLFTKAGSEERLTYNAIHKRIDALSQRLSFIMEWERAGWNPTRIHSLRSAFKSCLTGRTSDDLIEFLMGHSIGSSAKHYINIAEKELRQLYADVEKYLSLHNTSQDNNRSKDQEIRIQHRLEDQDRVIHTLTIEKTLVHERLLQQEHQMADIQEKITILLASSITLQKLDLLNLQDLTKQQPRKETALQAYQLHLEANLKELEEMQRQLLQDPALKQTHHRLLIQQVNEEDYQAVIKAVKNTQLLKD
jgi:hypothetical protein